LKISKVVITFIIFSLLLALPPFTLQHLDGCYWLIPGFWGVFVFVSSLTLFTIVLVLAVQKKNSAMYAQAFLGATTFKLLACLVFVLIFIKETKPEKIPFVVDFMYLYFLNMAFEVYGLLRNLRNQNSR
jgi:hydrogenase-4 membrane subunit HyfE